MVPVQVCALKQNVGYHAEDGQRDTLLDNLQLNEVERTSVLNEANTIGGNLAAILEEGYHPRKSNDTYEWPIARRARFL